MGFISRIFILIFMAAPAARALPVDISCGDHATEGVRAARLTQILTNLDRLGLATLTAPMTEGRVKVVFPNPQSWLFGRADVAWKSGWLKGRRLYIRNLPWGTEGERRNSVWIVAVALYQLQLERQWVLFRSGASEPLERDMQRLAEATGGKGRGYGAFYLARLRKVALSALAGALLQGGYYAMGEPFTPSEPELPQLSENLDEHLAAEVRRLERAIARATEPSEIQALKEKLKTFCLDFEVPSCPVP